MDNILAPLQDAFEGQIDFQGQHLAELLSTVLLIISGVLSFLIGYIYKDIHLTLWTGLGGTLFTALVVVPPWPIYNRNPEVWFGAKAKAGKVQAGGVGVVVDGVKVA